MEKRSSIFGFSSHLRAAGPALALLVALALFPLFSTAEEAGDSAVVVEDGGDFQGELDHLFSRIIEDRIPTDRLVESSVGTYFSPIPTDTAEPMTASRLRQTLWVLEQSERFLSVTPIPSIDDINRQAADWRQRHHAHPSVVAAIDLGDHAFIPTFSALHIDTQDLRYQPSIDLDVFQLSPFDAIFWEDCNQEHVKSSNPGLAFLANELLGLPRRTDSGASNRSLRWAVRRARLLLLEPLQRQSHPPPTRLLGDQYRRHPPGGQLRRRSPDRGDPPPPRQPPAADERLSNAYRRLAILREQRWQRLPRRDSSAPHRWLLKGKDRCFVGNFDAATTEDEILAVKRTGRARLVGRQAATLNRLWDNGTAGTLGPVHNTGNGLPGGFLATTQSQYLVGDFDTGTAGDEILAIDKPTGRSHTVSLAGGWWETLAHNSGSRRFALWQIGAADRYLAGDFVGDPQEQVPSIHPGGESRMHEYP